jgi:DNA-directed RNA polymerase subunit K/omega
MNFKKLNVGDNTITRDMSKFNPTGNVYESVAVIAKRANQISLEMKDEIAEKMEEFSSSVYMLVEVLENKEQKEVSRFYEKLPKPALIATQEFLDGKIIVHKDKPARK